MAVSPNIASFFNVGADVPQASFLAWGLSVETEIANGVSALAAHIAAADPHPIYLTAAEGAAAFAALSHSHTSGNVTDFAEAVDDRVAALLVAGANVSLTYNDTLNTLTIAATGGGGSGDVTAAAAFANDNRVLRSDGTGKGAQASGVTLDDSNNASGFNNVALAGYFEVPEITAPASPAADKLRVYAKDNGSGVTKFYVKDSAGTETELGAGGGGGRTLLGANRTYYVRTDGSDSNNGLANTSGGAFLTIQKALDVASTLDFGSFTVTIQIGDGTYTAANTIPRCVGMAGPYDLIIQGNSGTPGNVIISTTSASCFTTAVGASAYVKDLEVRTTTAGYALRALSGAIAFGNVRFGACAAAQAIAEFGGRILAQSNYSIVGSAATHLQSDGAGSQVEVGSRTITLTGTPAFSTAFALAATGGIIRAFLNTYSGSATGTRYTATTGGGIQTFGAGASALPGSGAGSATSPGWYA